MNKSKKKFGHLTQDKWQSMSAWNYTWAPGWTEQDVKVLKLAVTKFGIGRWKELEASKCLPGK
jgi:hypothetical protein